MVNNPANLPEGYMGIDFSVTNGDISFTSLDDIAKVSGYDNLRQAIILRLTTHKGFYEDFPEYGSELHLIQGLKQDNLLLSRAEQIVYAALLQEPRIQVINSIRVVKTETYALRIYIDVTPINSNNIYNIVYDYFLG